MNVVVRSSSFSSADSASVSCGAGEKAVGGGFDNTSAHHVITSEPTPSSDGATPTGWSIQLTGTGSGTVYVLCAS